MKASDYRRIARERLAGNWTVSLFAAFVATLLGGAVAATSYQVNSITYIIDWLPPDMVWVLTRLLLVSGLWTLVQCIIGGPVRQGYCQFLLKQREGEKAGLKDLFSQFHRFGDAFLLSFLEGLCVLLLTLLLIVPGVIATYCYAMAPFLMLENPNMKATEAMAASVDLMKGHKWELFCLDLSFIGWLLLCIPTLGIGHLWLAPYRNAARAAFYREISGKKT